MKRFLTRQGWFAVVAVALWFGAVAVRAQNGGIPLWTNSYDNSEMYHLAVDRGGNVFVIGTDSGGYVTIKYSGAGVPLWTNLYAGWGNGNRALAIVADTNGNAFVTGFPSPTGCATIKYSAAGVPLWTNSVDASETRGIAVDPAGNIIVTGSSQDYVTVAYSNAGVPLWINRYNGPGNGPDTIWASAVDASGNVIVTGSSTGTDASWGAATIKYSNTGVPLWTNRYDGPLNSTDFTDHVAVDGSGNVFVIGTVAIKYSAAGVPLWTNAYASGRAAAVDGGGNLYVARSADNLSGNSDVLTLKFSGAGALLWSNRFDGPTHANDSVRCLAVDAGGNVFVCADSYQVFDSESYFGAWSTVAYSSAGFPMWTNTYGSPDGGTSGAGAIAVDGGGNVVTVGSSVHAPTVMAGVVIKYSSALTPALTISRAGGNLLEVSWPSASSGFTLQENTDLNHSSNWSTVPAAIQDDGARKRIFVDPATGSRFYRLFKP